MFRFHKRYIALFILILLLSVSIYAQEGTETPTEAPVITEAPTDAPVVTESPTDAPIITEAPTDVPVETEAPTEAPVVTETPTEAPVLTEVPTETPLPTEAPAENLVTRPSGEMVEALIQYNPTASADSIAEMLRALGATELERLPQIGAMRVLLPSSVSNTASAQMSLQSNSLAANAGLLNVEPNYVWQLTDFPNDPFFSQQTNLKDGTGNDYSIFMQSAWAISPKDGMGVTVAVIDSGVDLQHPDFASSLVAGWDFYNDDNNPDDDNGHGTHVAGVIGANTNNAIGVAGMAYNAMILPIKVCGGSGCPTYEIAAGIIYAVDRGAKVINMSLGGSAISTTVQGAVNYALSRNVVVVAAAGNSGDGDAGTDEISYPASYPGVISVAAVDTNGTDIAVFSNSNSFVTVGAPGVNILSSVPIGFGNMGPNLEYDNTYSGTSMASPHVAGLAAMLIADGIATTPAQVREALICSALDKGTVGYDNSFGYGLIQADWALTWNNNSAGCQPSQPNDFIYSATNITTVPFSVVQPVNSRSITESVDDPTIEGQTVYQSLWYKFTPPTSGQYLISTAGSSWSLDTLLGVYQGQPAELTELAADNDFTFPFSMVGVSLRQGIPYYIQVGVNTGTAINEFVQLNINPAVTGSVALQENATAFRYTGTWNRVATTGSNGGYIMTTTDSYAMATFMVRGTSFNLTRMVGPAYASMQILIDAATIVNVDNNAATVRSATSPVNLGGNTGQWHLIAIRYGSGYGPLTIDAIQAADSVLPATVVGATRLEDTSSAFAYMNGTWSTPAGFHSTSTNNAYVEFRASGSSVTIWRSTGAGTGTMMIYLDGVVVASVDNSSLPNATSVPYSISGLVPRERVVRVVNASANTLAFDAAQSVNQSVMNPGTVFDERTTGFVYSGGWVKSTVSTTVANAGTLSTGSAADASAVDFIFNGNHFCLGYQQGINPGRIFIQIDGGFNYQIDYNPPAMNKAELCSYNVGINDLTDGVHSAHLAVNVGTFAFDYFKAVRRTVFTSAMGYMTETNAGFIYTGTWTTTTQASVGGGKFQGGSARRSNVDNGQETVAFNINGTGFVLYTSIAPDAGAYEVLVDGSGTPMDFVFQNSTFAFIDLWDGNFRFRPVGYGVIELSPGQHQILLRTTDPFTTGVNVDFDGIRVLP